MPAGNRHTIVSWETVRETGTMRNYGLNNCCRTMSSTKGAFDLKVLKWHSKNNMFLHFYTGGRWVLKVNNAIKIQSSTKNKNAVKRLLKLCGTAAIARCSSQWLYVIKYCYTQAQIQNLVRYLDRQHQMHTLNKKPIVSMLS